MPHADGLGKAIAYRNRKRIEVFAHARGDDSKLRAMMTPEQRANDHLMPDFVEHVRLALRSRTRWHQDRLVSRARRGMEARRTHRADHDGRGVDAQMRRGL
jgi:hypothetical protein